jgi:hypothetical protein
MTGKADRPWSSWSGEVHRVKKKKEGTRGKRIVLTGKPAKSLACTCMVIGHCSKIFREKIINDFMN